MLFGCSDEKIKGKPIYQKSEEISTFVNGAKWDKASEEVKAMVELYQKNKWKFQLLGDEMEYSGLNQEIIKLKVSIEEEDKKEAKANLALIQDYIRAIYYR